MQQSDLVMHIYVYIYTPLKLFPIIDYYKLLNIVPYTINKSLFIYFIYGNTVVFFGKKEKKSL